MGSRLAFRTLTALAACGLAAGALLGVSGPAQAAAPGCTPADPGLYSPTDLDADAASDLVVGVPRAKGPGPAFGAGAVDVHFAPRGSGPQRTQRFDESLFPAFPAPEYGDAFGASVAFTHLRPSVGSADEGDACADLVIGAPGYDDPNSGAKGSVIIAQGSNDGITATGAIRLVGKTVRERFGASVVADGDDIWIGAPNRTVDGQRQAGAIDHYRVADGAATLVQTLTENTPGIHGGAEADDHFGARLAVSATGPLIVGEPSEDLGAHAVDAGTVTVVFDNPDTGLLRSSETYSQNTPGIPGTAEAGDHFGASVSSYGSELGNDGIAIAVGVPDESLGSRRAAGTVDTFSSNEGFSQASGIQAISQNSAGVPGVDETGDHFGAQVLIVDGEELCIAAPGEDIGSVSDAGDVVCRTESNSWRGLYQGGRTYGDLGGAPQADAAAGSQLSRLGTDNEGDFFRGGEGLVVAIPGANYTYRASGQVVLPNAYTATDSTRPVANERYGVIAMAVSNGPSYDTA